MPLPKTMGSLPGSQKTLEELVDIISHKTALRQKAEVLTRCRYVELTPKGVRLSDPFYHTIVSTDTYHIPIFVTPLSRARGELYVRVEECETYILKQLTRLENIRELSISIVPAKRSINLINQIIINNAATLRHLVIDCLEEDTTQENYEIDLTPLKSSPLRMLLLKCRGSLKGMDSLPDSTAVYYTDAGSSLETELPLTALEESTGSLTDERTVPSLNDCRHLRKLALTYNSSKAVYTLPEDARPEYLSLPFSSDTFKLMLRKKQALSHLETLYFKSDPLLGQGNKYSVLDMEELDKLLGGDIMDVAWDSINIKEGVFPAREGMEHISLDASRQTVLEFDLDAMPRLISLKLNNIIPRFRITKKHSSLKYISVSCADIFSMDEMFIGAAPGSPLIVPTVLSLRHNCLDTLSGSFIDPSQATILDLDENLLTDRAMEPILEGRPKIISAGRNILSLDMLTRVDSLFK